MIDLHFAGEGDGHVYSIRSVDLEETLKCAVILLVFLRSMALATGHEDRIGLCCSIPDGNP